MFYSSCMTSSSYIQFHWCFYSACILISIIIIDGIQHQLHNPGYVIPCYISHWRKQHFQCGRWVADWVIAALSHGCSRGMIEASLERSQIVHWKQLWWLPSTRKNLLDVAKVLTSFPALAGPRSQLVKASLEAFAGFHRKQLHPVTAPVRDELIGWS